MSHTTLRWALGLVLVTAGASARAQVPTADTSGGVYAPPPSGGGGGEPGGDYGGPTSGANDLVVPGSDADVAAPQNQPGTEGAAGKGGKAAARDERGVYHFDEMGGVGGDEAEGLRWQGPSVPGIHVIRDGDTLWDICHYYFNNPWQWPKVWSYNPTITNPHWIYPGDLVRLHPAGQGPAVVEEVPVPDAVVVNEPTPGPSAVSLRQLAFVSVDDLKIAGTVKGASEEKIMLAQGDEVYIGYPSGKPPQVGQRYAIYSEVKPVVHPDGGSQIGSYVQLRGEVEIAEVKKGRTARGYITYSTDIIERGNRVGTMKTQFKQVNPVAADRDLEGVIVGVINSQELVGADQMVFIDRGAQDGVKAGNRLLVVRRGDAYIFGMGPSDRAGQNDRKYPDEAIAQITVVEAGKKTSVAVVNYSAQEAEIGDRAVMRKGK